MSFNFNFGGMPNFDLGNIQVPDFSLEDYGFDQGLASLSQDAETKRQEANEARDSATTQYEADVAEFKDSQASDAENLVSQYEQEPGLGTLGQWDDLSGTGSTATNTYTPSAYTRPGDRYVDIDNWGEPGATDYVATDEIIDPTETFVEDPVSNFMDDNPYNDVWTAPPSEVLTTAGEGATAGYTHPADKYAPINNPFEPIETDFDPVRDDDIIDPGAPDPGIGWWDDPDEPGPDQDYWDEEEGVYEIPENGDYVPPPDDIVPPPPPPIYVPPPPPPMVTGPTATPMNRLIAMQTGMFGGQPQGQYKPYEEPAEETLLQPQPPGFPPGQQPVLHGNQGTAIRQPTRNLKKLFSNPLDKGLGQLPTNGQNDTLTQTVQAGFRPRR